MSGLDYSQASVLAAAGSSFVLDGVGVSELTWTDTTTPGAPSLTAHMGGVPLFSVLPTGTMIWQAKNAPSPHLRAAVLASALELPRPWFTTQRRVLRYRGYVVPVEGLQIDSLGRVLI